ncbi:MAG: hypothetical protein R3D55_15615 [Chloroflexota bacterium]
MSILRAISSVPFELHVGDPSVLGWLTFVFYLVAAAACLVCALQAKRIFPLENSRAHAVIWLGLAFFLTFLGINKQLDLQSWFTAVVKAIAWEQGWYEFGQRAQIIFLAGFGLVGLAALLALVWLVRHYWRRYFFIFFGLLFIFRFIFVRIATFYGISLPELSQFTGGIRVNSVLELAGSIVIILTALNNLRYRSAPSPQPETATLNF